MDKTDDVPGANQLDWLPLPRRPRWEEHMNEKDHNCVSHVLAVYGRWGLYILDTFPSVLFIFSFYAVRRLSILFDAIERA